MNQLPLDALKRDIAWYRAHGAPAALIAIDQAEAILIALEQGEWVARAIIALEERYEREKVDHARQHGRSYFDFEDDRGLDGRSYAASEAADIVRAAPESKP